MLLECAEIWDGADGLDVPAVTHGNGTGGESIYGDKFADEKCATVSTSLASSNRDHLS